MNVVVIGDFLVHCDFDSLVLVSSEVAPDGRNVVCCDLLRSAFYEYFVRRLRIRDRVELDPSVPFVHTHPSVRFADDVLSVVEHSRADFRCPLSSAGLERLRAGCAELQLSRFLLC